MEDRILRALTQAQGFISGEQLSEQLGVSRTAVWKHIGKLREKGYAIDSVTNRGYRLHASCIGRIYGWELEKRFAELSPGLWKRLVFSEETDSTNQAARRYLSEHPDSEGTVFICETQTAGRGRRGKSWLAPAGCGIWMSFILKPKISTAKAPMLTLLAGLAVQKAIRECCPLKPLIKWPNDILLNGKKVCGILTEMQMEDMETAGVVVGLGINVGNEDFPEELREIATSIAIETGGAQTERVRLAIRVLRCFERYYEAFSETADFAPFKEEYEGVCANIGREIRVYEGRGSYAARALGIDRDGGLRVLLADGSEKTVASGEVTIRGAMGYAE